VAPIGKTLVLAGIAIAIAGLAIWGLSSVPYIGKLPGDIYLKRGNFTFYFPLATSILISIIATILFSLMRR
jgi:predicted phosphohydrolase